jgi:hypothetical protein
VSWVRVCGAIEGGGEKAAVSAPQLQQSYLQDTVINISTPN